MTVWAVITIDNGVLDSAVIFGNREDATKNFNYIARLLQEVRPETFDCNDYAAWTDDFTVAIYEREVQ